MLDERRNDITIGWWLAFVPRHGQPENPERIHDPLY